MTRAEMQDRIDEIVEELNGLDQWSWPWLREDLEAELRRLVYADAE